MYHIPLLLVGSPEKANDFIETFLIEQNLSQSQVIVLDIEEGKKEVSLEQIKYLTSFSTRSVTQERVSIIKSFETASREAQNALLKTLEEALANQQFILCTKNKEYVLPTIRSRARVIQLPDTGLELRTEIENTLGIFLEKPVDALADPVFQAKKTEDAVELLDQMILFWRKKLPLNPEKATEIIKKMLHMKHLVLIHNVQPQLAIDSILIAMHRLR